MMQVRVLLFGVLKDWLGASSLEVELAVGSTVADLLEKLSEGRPQPLLRSIAVSVNAEFAPAGHLLREGDEVGLLPPVSGGSSQQGNADASAEERSSRELVATALTGERIDAARLIAEAKDGADGAVAVFDGIVRNNTKGRPTLYLDYEAYEAMAAKQMHELALEARTRFAVRHVTLVHRLGRLNVGETSVLIVVASAHRGAAFDACRWLIDTLKKTVPIWKKETFADGAVWAAGEPFPEGLAVEASRDS
jgi:molybdopterin synthase catalytic subunit/molybdopterin converting factor small subunit